MKSITEYVINENLHIISLCITGAILIYGGLDMLTGCDNYVFGSFRDYIKDFIDDAKINKIVNRLKDDEDIQDFLKHKNKSGWKKLITSKLNDDELKYINAICKSKFND